MDDIARRRRTREAAALRRLQAARILLEGNHNGGTKTMHGFKNPFQSMTIWGAAITLASVIGRMFGYEVPTEEINGAVTWLGSHWNEIGEFIGIVTTVIGRFRASKAIG